MLEGGEPQAIVAFPANGGGFKRLYEVADRIRDDEGSLLGRKFVFRPPVGGASDAPSQLVTLWALLFALSELTRYYPAAWAGALNADESEVAVTLEHGLEIALTLVPDLLNGGLAGPVSRWVEEMRQEQLAQGEELPAQQEVPAEEEPPAPPEELPRF